MYFSSGAGVPVTAQYEQNVRIGIRRRRDVIVLHNGPETALLNLGQGRPVASHWLRVRDRRASEPFAVCIAFSRTEIGDPTLHYK